MDQSSLHQLLLVSAIAFLVPFLVSRVPSRLIPAVVGEIIAGAIFGKSGFELIDVTPILEFLALFGFAYLMFLSGLELDASLLLSSGNSDNGRLRAIATSPLGLSISVFIGSLLVAFTCVALLSLIGLAPDLWLTTLILTTTSLGLVLPTLKEQGLSSSTYGQTIIACAFVADFVTLMLIGIFAAVKHEGVSGELALVLLLPVAFLVAWRVGATLSHLSLVSRTMAELAHATAQLQVRGSLALMISFVVLAETAGTELILGSFMAGAIVSLFSPREGASIRVKLDAIGYGFFIPIFFINVGAELDLRALGNSTDELLLLPAFLIAAYLVKLLPSLLLRQRFSPREALAAGFLLSSRLSLIIAASLIGRELGIISEATNTVIVLVAVITATLSPAAFILATPRLEAPTSLILIAGSGTTGQTLASHLRARGTSVALIDTDPGIVREMLQRGFDAYEGDARDRDTLLLAGVESAGGLVAATADDTVNLAVCTLAREAFGLTHLVARVNDANRLAEFQNIGVRSVSVQQAASSTLLNVVMRPNLFELLVDEPRGYEIREVVLHSREASERELREVKLPGNSLVLLIRRDGELLVPRGSTVLKAGDSLTLAGDPDSVREAAIMLTGPTPLSLPNVFGQDDN